MSAPGGMRTPDPLLRRQAPYGESKKLPVETVPVCPSCGTLFRQTEKHIGDLFWFEADCMEKHI